MSILVKTIVNIILLRMISEWSRITKALKVDAGEVLLIRYKKSTSSGQSVSRPQ